MDRCAHQCRLDGGLALERAGQRVPFEALEPRPEPDVHRRRVLGLDPADPFERPWDRQRGPLEQELAREQGAIQLTLGEDAVHRRSRLDHDGRTMSVR
jgi:hypothetical protein